MKALPFRCPPVWMALAFGSIALAQPSEVSIQSPPPPRIIGRFLKPFHLEKRIVPPAKLSNTPRLEQLVRSGNLYLSAQDVIALALENNLDIAVERYGPFLSREVLMRAQAGGLLRGTDTPVSAGPICANSQPSSPFTVSWRRMGWRRTARMRWRPPTRSSPRRRA